MALISATPKANDGMMIHQRRDGQPDPARLSWTGPGTARKMKDARSSLRARVQGVAGGSWCVFIDGTTLNIINIFRDSMSHSNHQRRKTDTGRS
jgi:hypothetical protein